MTYSEDSLLPLSYLSQLYYCKRRAALLLLERQWEDNIYTAEGSEMHEKVHDSGRQLRSGISRLQSVPLISLNLGLSGKSDCIELISDPSGYKVPGIPGNWLICPVEYKHGKKRNEIEYEVQLCAQGICLEEMWKCKITNGFIYYTNDRKRKNVVFTDDLRQMVIRGSKELQEMLINCSIPLAEKTKKCPKCSLVNLCMPAVKKNAINYINKLYISAQGGMDM
jgi:CRISPR-associated exonuclease Cas4